MHANPCLAPAPQDFNNPSASANLRLTPTAFQKDVGRTRAHDGHAMPGSTACGEGTIQQPMASVLVSRYAAIAALFHFNGFLIFGAPKSEEPISLHDSLWFYNEDHEPKPVMIPINGCGVAFSERRRLSPLSGSCQRSHFPCLGKRLPTTDGKHLADGNFSLRYGPDETTYFEVRAKSYRARL